MDKYIALQNKWKDGEWSELEKCALKKSVLETKELNWYLCSVEVGTRSPEHCKNRWELKEETDHENRPWGDQEQTLLFEKMLKYSSSWKKIAGQLWIRNNKNLGNLVTNEINKIKHSKFSKFFHAITLDRTVRGKGTFFTKNKFLTFF